MDLFEAIETRRSVREVLPGKRIPRAALEKLFSFATQAPSSWTLQPWKFLVIEDSGRRARIRELARDQPKVTDSSALVCVLGYTDLHAHKREIFDQWRASGAIADAVHAQWLKAVAMEYPTEHEKHEFAIRNSSFAAMTLMLAAWGMGYATCPMIGFDKPAVSGFIGVPEDWIPSFLIRPGHRTGGGSVPAPTGLSFRAGGRVRHSDAGGTLGRVARRQGAEGLSGRSPGQGEADAKIVGIGRNTWLGVMYSRGVRRRLQSKAG